jgi:hypothetical protein
MAPDQRYCVDCGERRGKPRFTAPTTGAKAPAGGQLPKRAPRQRSRISASASTTLIAGVATLLLALGVGVLIGENNAPTPVAQKATVITVSGGAGTGTTAATAPSTGSSTQPTASTPTTAASSGKTGSKASSPASSKATAKVAPVSATKATSPAAVNAANQAVAKTLGSSHVGNATAQPGQSCTAGTPGCQGGKQTGRLFGGG